MINLGNLGSEGGTCCGVGNIGCPLPPQIAFTFPHFISIHLISPADGEQLIATAEHKRLPATCEEEMDQRSSTKRMKLM